MTGDTEPKRGRPRSDAARLAVLYAVDDLLVECGYAAMTMKGIAERAGVGRQTVYRWWSSKAEILLEACVHDAGVELSTVAAGGDLVAYLGALSEFLTVNPAGLAYRALVGEAQHDPEVRRLLQGVDVLTPSAEQVLAAAGLPVTTLAVAWLVGPVLTRILIAAQPLTPGELAAHAEAIRR